jgi:hypothetical protein
MEGATMSVSLPPDLRTSVLEHARATPSPTKSKTTRANAIMIALGVATAATMIAAFGISLGGRPLVFVALSAVGWAAIAASVSALSQSRGKTMLGKTRMLLVVAATCAAPAIFGWVMSLTMAWPEVREPAGTWQTHLTCFAATLVLSLGPVIALAFVRRASDPVHPRATGAAIGAAAGAWGGVLIDMHCPITHPLHIALAHVMPVLVYAAIMALASSRLFGVRAMRRER